MYLALAQCRGCVKVSRQWEVMLKCVIRNTHASVSVLCTLTKGHSYLYRALRRVLVILHVKLYLTSRAITDCTSVEFWYTCILLGYLFWYTHYFNSLEGNLVFLLHLCFCCIYYRNIKLYIRHIVSSQITLYIYRSFTTLQVAPPRWSIQFKFWLYINASV